MAAEIGITVANCCSKYLDVILEIQLLGKRFEAIVTPNERYKSADKMD